jgi:hypothetical protein
MGQLKIVELPRLVRTFCVLALTKSGWPVRVLDLEQSAEAPLELKFGFLLEKSCFLIAAEIEESL